MHTLFPKQYAEKTAQRKSIGTNKAFFSAGNIQPKLSVNKPGDAYEQEADAMADRVMSMHDSGTYTHGEKSFFNPASPGIQRKPHNPEDELDKEILHRKEKPGGLLQRKCAGCEEEEKLQRKEIKNVATEPRQELDNYVGSLDSSGQPMPDTVRNFFEPKFGLHFENVRIHSDSSAAYSAQTIEALAYTSGNNIVFNQGQYSPDSDTGKKLLAHELTHVAQQSKAKSKPIIQKQEKKGNSPQKKDVVIVTSGTGDDAKSLSKDAVIIRVSSIEELKQKLKAINYPIRTLYISSHALPEGSIFIESKTKFVEITPKKFSEELSGSIKPDFAPDTIDFRGCTVGQSPEGMETMRKALGAKTATAGNCYIVNLPNGPINIHGKPITKASQVTKENRTDFESGFKKLLDLFGPAKKCILDSSEEAYFKAGGHLVAQWFSPHLDTKWEEGKTVCYSDTKTEIVDPSKAKNLEPGDGGNCKLITVNKP